MKNGRDKGRELVAGKVEIQLHDQAKVGFSKSCPDSASWILVAAVHNGELSLGHKCHTGRYRREVSRHDSVHLYTVALLATHWYIVHQDNSSVERFWRPRRMDGPHGMGTPVEKSGVKQEAGRDTWVVVSGGGDDNHRYSF